MAVADEVPGSLGATLVSRLQSLRDAVLWKIEGVDEYDLRRPLTPTGTNLLGLVRHLSAVEFGYFGDVFGRPTETELPWAGHEDENADMWATVRETPVDVVHLYREAWANAAQTFARCDLDTRGRVPWWPDERRDVTLGAILVHMIGETARHAGHMDILRESLDGAAGLTDGNDNLAHPDADDRTAYVRHLEKVAREATGRGKP